ncbi:MAG: L,D-transpeptidase, partial [Methylocystis sp.]|nr:L,D-transpeptidase [Methylocystis sp.]
MPKASLPRFNAVSLALAAALLSGASPASARPGAYSAAPAYGGGYDAPAPQSALGGGLIEALVGAAGAPRGLHYAAPAPGSAPPAYRAAPAQTYAAYAPHTVSRAIDPVYERTEVDYHGGEAPGTILVDTTAKHLYLVQGGGRAIRYGIGVGRPGFEWSGVKSVSRKAEWPDWRPPANMIEREAERGHY